ncbi:drug/metabolite exporter YedA [Dyella sp.]|uniref:drug/metabolite exporter YedA n=1 Tax=Dyella sp. TaxID=1869338 RepID=UPI002ED64C78
MNDSASTSSGRGMAAALYRPTVLLPMALFALYVIWGSTYLGIRFALESYPPFLMAGIRFLVASTLLFGFLKLRGTALPSLRQWRNAGITGVLLLGMGNGLVCFAEEHVSSGIAAVAVACVPLFVALFAGMYGEWPSRPEIIGLVVGFLGVIVLNLGGSLSGSPTGALVLIIASMSWAFGSAWSRKQDMPSGPMNTAVQMLCASVALLVTGAVTGEHLPSHPTVHATLALAYLVVFGSLIAFSAYLYLLRHARPAVASSYAYVNPPVAVLFGALLANEHVRLLDVAGMGIILAGVATITLARTRRRPR